MIVTADFECKETISEDAIDLIKKILQTDPSKRLNIPEIFAHPWMLKVPKSMAMFNDEEKKKIEKEFTFNDCDRLNRNEKFDSKISHGFSEYNLETTMNELLRNHSTKSIILAPFNSSATSQDVNFSESFRSMMRSRKAVVFSGRCREINRNYEENNNQDMDNGVYNEVDSEEEDSQLLEHKEEDEGEIQKLIDQIEKPKD